MAKSDTSQEAFTAEQVSDIAVNLNRKKRDALKWITDDEANEYVSPSAVVWCIENKLATKNGKDHVKPTELGLAVRKAIS